MSAIRSPDEIRSRFAIAAFIQLTYSVRLDQEEL
jgi:hypothetical protein